MAIVPSWESLSQHGQYLVDVETLADSDWSRLDQSVSLLFGNELSLEVDHRYHHSLFITSMITRSSLNRARKIIRTNYKASFTVNALANARNTARVTSPRRVSRTGKYYLAVFDRALSPDASQFC